MYSKEGPAPTKCGFFYFIPLPKSKHYIMITFLKTYGGTIKTVLVCAVIAVAVWFIIDWNNLRQDKARQDENWRQEKLEDSLKYKALELSKEQIQDFLTHDRKDLLEALKDSKIKTDRIESILSQVLMYRDTAKATTDFSPILEAITKNENKTLPFVDSTKCLVVKGNIKYENNALKLNVTSREFNNKTDVVAYWERREWKFLFWKTRFLGKKQFTAKSFTECGEIGTVKIEKAKN